MPPSGNFLPPSRRIICGTGRQSHRKPTTTKITCTYKELVLKALELMETISYPGNWEEHSGTYDVQYFGEEDDEQFTKRRNLYNFLVSSRRSFSAIRHEVASAKNLYSRDWMTNKVIHAIIDVANANNETQLIASGRKLVEEIFGKESVHTFADDAVVSYFVSHGARPFTLTDSIIAKLYELRNSPRGNVLSKLIQTFLVTSPHSMLTERAVKCHTQLKTDLRSNLSRKSVNRRMRIALNSSGIANFHPRPLQQSPGFWW